MIGQLLQIITSTEIPSWKRPQNYKVWQLERTRGRENDEDEKKQQVELESKGCNLDSISLWAGWHTNASLP